MAKVTTTTTVYRSKKMSDHQKRIWVTKYLEFKKVYPHIKMSDWCKMNYLSPHTFAAWYGDVRYNKELAASMKRRKFEEPEDRQEDDEQLEFENLEAPKSNPEINAESSNDEEEPDVKVKTETDFTGLRMDQDEVMDGKYVISPEYQEILNYTGDGIMGYVEIPDIDVNLPIYHGTSEEVLQDGAGHLEASSLPVGGEGTHAVISAHRGLPSAKLFSDLDELETGDVFFIHILNETHAYQVDQIQVVKPDELDSLRVVDGQDLVTLLTCTPYAVNTHRLLVRGVRIPYEEAKKVLEDAEDENTLSRWVKEYAVSIAAGTVLLVLLVLAVKIRKRKRKRKKKRKKKHGKWKHRK